MGNVSIASVEQGTPSETGLPLTEAQRGLWFAQRLDPHNPVFNTGQYLELDGHLDTAAFARAVARTVADADVLSMRVREINGELDLVLDPAHQPTLRLIDVADQPDPREAALAAMWTDMRAASDPSRDPVAAEWLFRIAPDKHLWYQRIHHIAIDGYGTAMLVRRVCDEYAVECGSNGAGAGTFDRWSAVTTAERDYLSSPGAVADRAFWHEWFQDKPEIPDLASGPVSTDNHYLTQSAEPSPSLDAALAKLASTSNVVWPDVLVALTAAWLARHTPSAEAIVGVPAMERLGRKAARVPGMVMNVLPVRLEIDEDRSLSDWLTSTGRTLQRARKHGRYRGEQLRRDLGLLGGSRRLHGPLINVLPFERSPSLPGLTAVVHTLATGPVDDLTVTWRADGLGRNVALELDGNPRRYSEQDLAAFANRLSVFLQAAGAATRLADVSTLTPAESRHWLSTVNDTARDVPNVTLTSLIERTMKRVPQAAALKFGSETWSYADLDARSAALANTLIARGARRGDVIAVCADRSFELVLGLVSVLRAGAAYLPVEPSLPSERIETMLSSAACTLVISTSETRSLIPGSRNIVVATPAEPATGAGQFMAAEHEPGDPAYVIFTSGSTGVPKGAMVEHRAIVNRLEWMREFYAFEMRDRFLQKTPASFDVSVWEFFLPLTTGALLVVAPPGAHRDPAWLTRIVREEDITTLHFVPSMLAVFLNEPAVRGLELRRVFCSGEELAAGLRDRFHELVSADLHNLYGPTEAAVDVTYWPAGRDDHSNPVPIGFPVWNTQMYVLDERLRPVPPGVPAHLYIAGVQLGRGYVGRPDLTADRFIPNPYGPDGSRMYKTGDLARWRDDGAIVFLGRSDHQVKIRGFRIELDEIEAVLGSAPGVGQAAVVVREVSADDRRLVAYVIPQPETSAGVADWKTWLGTRLPEYMVPSAFVTLDEFPLSPNGKLVRARLPEPELTATSTARGPKTATERALMGHFSKALGLATDLQPAAFGVDDDFFSLGGHSLLAARVMSAVRDEWHVDAGLGLLFAHPTVARLARRIDELATKIAGHEIRLEDYGIGALITLQEAPRSQTPLFCIHPAGGLSWCYRSLARAITPSRPAFGVQAQGLDAGTQLPPSLKAMAAHYADQLERVQPTGPFSLLGWSVGGILAHAAAVELQRRDRDVRVLAMLDAYPSDRWRDQPPPDESVALTALLQMAGQDSSQVPKESLTREAVLAFLRRSGHPLGSLSDQVLTGVVRVVQHNSRLVREHHHEVFDGDLLYFRAGVGHDDPTLDPLDWQSYVTGSITQHVVPYPHPELPGAAAVGHIAPLLSQWLTQFADNATLETRNA